LEAVEVVHFELRFSEILYGEVNDMTITKFTKPVLNLEHGFLVESYEQN